MKIEDLKTIVVIGAGVMGQQIAMNTAIKGRSSGYQVILCDSFPAAVEKAKAWADQYLAGRIAKGRLTQEQVDEVKANLTITEDVDGSAAKADLIIEAIIEKLEVKRELFGRISKLCKPDTVLSTNSSNIVSSKLADITEHPERLMNIHYFNPALVMELVELVRGPHTGDEAGRLAGSFDRMFERLEQSFEAEKQFTSDASHELRTPTAVILSQCSFAEKYGETREDYQEAISVIHRQADKMSLLISRLLDITRLDLGSQKLKRESVDFSEMIALICEEQDSGGRDISLSADISPGVIVDGDPFLLSRAAVNLLENARKYGREGGRIRVRLAQDGAEAVLTVEDDGIGIAPENLEKIWQRFYQADPSRGEQSGLGLGLSMVRQIAELHGGSAEAESELGKGSRFTVRIPRLADRRPS